MATSDCSFADYAHVRAGRLEWVACAAATEGSLDPRRLAGDRSGPESASVVRRNAGGRMATHLEMGRGA